MIPSPSLDRRRLLLTAGGASLAAASALLPAGAARAQLRVDVGRGTAEPLPIAVSPFAGDSPADTERGVAIAEVIQADLDNSGLFKTIDRQAYIQSPEETRGIPRFPDWRQINAQALVTGIVQGAGGGSLAVEFRLWDVFAGQQLRGLRFDASDAGWRRVAHKVADVVYERLTGEKGYFDTRIAYIGETGSAARRTKRLAIMDQDGANQRYLTDGSNLALTPRISPDGRRIAYLAFRNGPPRIMVKEIDTGREGALGDFRGITFAPRFSPDGRTLLITQAQNGNSEIYAWDIATRRASRLTDSAAIDTSPSFSPDGGQIVFNSDRGGSPQLYVMGRGGGGARRISYGQGRYGTPAWSPARRPHRLHEHQGRHVPHRNHEARRQRRAAADPKLHGPGAVLGAQRPTDHVRPRGPARRPRAHSHGRHQRLQRARDRDLDGRLRPGLVALDSLAACPLKQPRAPRLGARPRPGAPARPNPPARDRSGPSRRETAHDR
jgi:TolB protein